MPLDRQLVRPDVREIFVKWSRLTPFTCSDPNANWLYNTAPYLSYQFKQLKKLFPYNKIYLSEFGFAEPFSYLRQDQYQILYDTDRTAYYQDYLGECLKAINDDGIPLAGVFAWSFIDK